MSKVKKHALLSQITNAVNGNLPTVNVEIQGATYTLQLLKPEGDDWANSRTDGTNMATMILSTKKPTVAAALVSIDGIPVEQLFEPDYGVMEADEKQILTKQPAVMRDWTRSQVFEWLREECSILVVDELYSAYSKMSSANKDEVRQLGNFSKRTISPV